MGDVVDRAHAMADALRVQLPAGFGATADVRAVRPPCVLVVPVPTRRYSLTDCAWAATWTVYALATVPGDLAAAAQLETMADVVAQVLDGVLSAEPATYVIPGLAESTPIPGYRIVIESEETWQ